MRNNIFFILLASIFTLQYSFAQTLLCNTDVSICTPGIAGPFGFLNGGFLNGAGTDFAQGTCATGTGGLGDNYGFILLTITTSGPLNLLVNGNSTNGYIDVIVFNIPSGDSPCAAVMNPSNEIGCNFASSPSGCMQFGNTFPCISTVPAPNVSAGDQIMIIVHDWSNVHNSFTLQLNPNGAQTGPPDATINTPSNMLISDPPQTITSASGGGTWSASCGACINPITGDFNAALAGDGEHDIYYTVGSPPCNSQDTTSITVGLPCNLNATVTPIITSCIGAADGSAFVTILDGVSPYTFSWNDPANTADSIVTGLLAGNYAVTITDDSLCVLTLNVTIGEPAPFTLTLDGDSTQCSGEQTGFAFVSSASGGTPPYNYSWNTVPPQLNDSAINLAPGNYTVTLTDNNNCQTTASIDIYDRIPLVLTLDAEDTQCSGGIGNGLAFVSSLSGGVGPYVYLWNDPSSQTTDTAFNLNSGLFTVLVTDQNNCQISESVNVISPNGVNFTLLANSTDCFGASNVLAYVETISGGTPPYSYSWNTTVPQITDTAFNLIPGNYTLSVTDSNNCVSTASILVESPTDLTNTFSTTNLSCNGNNSGSITSSVSGGTAPFSYLWSNNATTENISNLAAGTYTLIYTDANGCSKTETATITEPTNILLAINSTNVTCKNLNNGSANVNSTGGTAPYTYLWSDSETSQSINNLSPGIYSVEVTDNNLCTATASVTISEPDSLLVSIASITNVLCNGNNTGSINVSVSGGTQNYNYNWSNGTTNQNLSNASAGNYTLNITDANNCTATASGTISQPTVLTVSLSSTNITCFGSNNGSITSAVNGGVAPYSYAWSNGTNLANAGNLAAGNYTLTVTDANGCSRTATSTITQPQDVVITFSNSNVLCFGDNSGSSTVNVVSGGTAPFSYLWNSNANNQATQTAGGLSAGSYSILITDANGCTYSASTNISEPTLLTLTTTSTQITCAGLNNGTASVSPTGGTSPYSYLWNNPSATAGPQVSSLSPGTYQVNVVDGNNCLATATVEIAEPSQIVVLVETDSANCWGESTGALTIIATGGTNSTLGFSYSIDGGSTFQESNLFSNLQASIYPQIIVKDLGSSENCLSNLAGATIFQPNLMFVAIVPEDTTLQLQESVELSLNVDASQGYDISSITSIVWTPNDGLSCSDCINPILLTYNDYTIYNATIFYDGVNGAQCNTAASTLIQVENNLNFFIPNAFTPNGDGTNDFLFVYGESLKNVNLQIYNRWGEKVFQSKNQYDGWDGTFKGNVVAPGVYTYFFEGEYLDGKKIAQKGSVSVLR